MLSSVRLSMRTLWITVTDEYAYVALDPGETTGWAKLNDTGDVVSFGQVIQRDLPKWLDINITPTVKAVIVEDYRNYGWKQQKKWSRNQTSKNIGAIEMVCSMRGIPCILQAASVKAVGYKWAGLGEAPSNHSISHQFDAVAHGVVYVTNIGVRIPSKNVHS